MFRPQESSGHAPSRIDPVRFGTMRKKHIRRKAMKKTEQVVSDKITDGSQAVQVLKTLGRRLSKQFPDGTQWMGDRLPQGHSLCQCKALFTGMHRVRQSPVVRRHQKFRRAFPKNAIENSALAVIVALAVARAGFFRRACPDCSPCKNSPPHPAIHCYRYHAKHIR